MSRKFTVKHTIAAIAAIAALSPLFAADSRVSQTPLAKASTQAVAPNLLYILDDSGSMMQQYTPDYVSERWSGTVPHFSTTGGSTGDRHCRDSLDDSNTGVDLCVTGDLPYMAGLFNKQYYNPRIYYQPGIKSDFTSYPAQTDWTKVATDGYGKQMTNQLEASKTTINITNEIPERVWCASASDDPTDTGKCKRNLGSYSYPDATYAYGRGTGGYSGDNTGASGNIKLVYGAPYYFNIKPLYCTNDTGTSCTATKGGSYLTELPFRWCKLGSGTNLGDWTNCQAKKDSNFYIASFLEPETANKAVGSFKVATSLKKDKTLTLLVQPAGGGTDLVMFKNLPTGSSDLGSKAASAKLIRDAINGSSDYSATCNDSNCSDTIVNVSAKLAGKAYNGIFSPTGFSMESKVNPAGGTEGASYFSRVTLNAATDKYQIDGGKPPGRNDCVKYTDGCSYAEEMTNFANWYAYYRTRMQSMKTASTLAFKDIDSRFRVGFTQINNRKSKYVSIQDFVGSHKTTWFSKLIDATPSGGTPLLTSLAFAGKVYAGLKPEGISDDPVQYSCQQNFTLMTTDGYTNESGTPTKLDGSAIGNQDGSGTERPYYEGTTASENSLADTAMYYASTDLRSGTPSECKSPLTGADVCENNLPISNDDSNTQQHMRTFTLGMGVDGQLRYRKDYRTATAGDFFNIKNGSLDWPVPKNNTETAVDDLWHAAVSGRGQYFSAGDPAVLVSSLKEALASISTEYGAGAAAATSTTEPVSGDNFAYVATYTTGKWIGNLEARTINTTNGTVNLQAIWCLENIAADPVKLTTECTGTMSAKFDEDNPNADSRSIYFNQGGSLTAFVPTNLSTYAANFDVTKLNQYAGWSTEYRAAASSEKLINYLRGQSGFEIRASNTYPLFRSRENVTGDFIGSPPKYVCKASAAYEDPGYSSFASSLGGSGTCTRTPMIYIGGNDGMLHAVNANNGQEQWTFVPTPAISEMWRLADSNYAGEHRFFVDGTITVSDVCTANCSSASATWKTILVGALGGGVVQGNDRDNGAPWSGYFALDISTPGSPILLWEITSKDTSLGSKIGFSLGKPWLVKVKDDDGNPVWVALLSSGMRPSGGNGSLLVVNAYTGSLIRTFDMSTSTGFSRFSPQLTKPGVDQTAERVYGGDLEGYVWRINPNTSSTPLRIMSTGKPFTTAPELTRCNNKTVVYIGSGKFIESADMTDQTQQSFYGFLDDYETKGEILSPTSKLDKLVVSGGKTSASTGSSTLGYYLDLPDIPTGGGSERVAMVDPKLSGNYISFATNIPESGVCLASGRANFYQIPISTCNAFNTVPKALEGTVESFGNSLVVGMTFIKLPDGSIKVISTGSDGTIKTRNSGKSSSSPPFASKRVNWREIIRQ